MLTVRQGRSSAIPAVPNERMTRAHRMYSNLVFFAGDKLKQHERSIYCSTIRNPVALRQSIAVSRLSTDELRAHISPYYSKIVFCNCFFL